MKQKTPSILTSLGISKNNKRTTKTTTSLKVEQRIALLKSLTETQASRELLSAARQGDLPRVQYLLNYVSGCDVNFASLASEDGLGKGATALHFAAYGNYAEVCEALIAAGAKTQAVTGNGSTALHVAVKKSALEAVQALLRLMGSEGIMAKDLLGNSALSYAKTEGVKGVFRKMGFMKN